MVTSLQDLLSDLEKKADAATPGPWGSFRAFIPTDGEYDYCIAADQENKKHVIAEVFGRTSQTNRPNAFATSEYIAAANPATVKKLIAALRVADEDLNSAHNISQEPKLRNFLQESRSRIRDILEIK